MRLYSSLGARTEQEAFDLLTGSMRNFRNWDYYVDWGKARDHVAEIERDLNLLNSLLGKPDFDASFLSLVRDYPQVVRAIPILFATRSKDLTALPMVSNPGQFPPALKVFDIFNANYGPNQAEDLLEFVKLSGIKNLFSEGAVKNLVDYVLGVEVGLDSNARKGRSGQVMEDLVEVKLRDIRRRFDFQYMRQASVRKLQNEWGISSTSGLGVRTFDFAVKTGAGLSLIEVNFYSASGSKLAQVCGNFISVQEQLAERGINFVWVTDGLGWHSELPGLKRAFAKIHQVLNVAGLEAGGLEEALGLE